MASSAVATMSDHVMIFFRANEFPQVSPRQLNPQHSAVTGHAKAEMHSLAHAWAMVFRFFLLMFRLNRAARLG